MKGYYLACGISKFPALLPADQLPAVTSDLKILEQLFRGWMKLEPVFGGMRTENKSLRNLLRELQSWAGNLTEDVSLVLYIATHGACPPSGYCLLESEVETFAEDKINTGTTITAREIAASLGIAHLKQVLVIFDCCHAARGFPEFSEVVVTSDLKWGRDQDRLIDFLASSRTAGVKDGQFVPALNRIARRLGGASENSHLDLKEIVTALKQDPSLQGDRVWHRPVLSAQTACRRLPNGDSPVTPGLHSSTEARAGAGTSSAVPASEDPASTLRLLRTHLLAVQAEWADKLAKCAAPDKPLKGASRLFGREQDLTELRKLLRTHHQIAVTGPGGLGKTALCAELVKRLAAEPAEEGRALLRAGLFVHDFYQEPSLAAFVTGILQQAGLECEEPAHQPALAALVLRRPGVMLYIEGAEKLTEAAALLEFLDAQTALLLTTRDPRQAEYLTEYPLEPLESGDAAAALHYYAETSKTRTRRAGPWPYGPEHRGWALLARDLGGHPLACRLAGELCARLTLDPAAMHEQLVEEGVRALLPGEAEANKQNSKRNLAVLFRQSALAVREACPGREGAPSPALVAWHALTLGGTNPVPFSILQALGVAEARDLTPLVELGLVWSRPVAAEEVGTLETGYALTHALLGEWARTGLEEFGCPAVGLLERAVQWGMEFRDWVVDHARVPGGPERYMVVVPVAEALLREVEMLPELEPHRLYSFYHLPARMHEFHARHLAAEAIYRRGLERMEASSGPAGPPTATALNNLASLLQDTNRLEEAEPLLRRALAIAEASYGNDHPSVAVNLNNLALLLQTTNRLEEAKQLMRRALAIDEASYGGVHPNVARDLSNLAALLQTTNRLEEAEPLMRRALAIDEASYASDHPNVAIRLNNLALLLKETNRQAEAEPLMRRALAIDEASYGSDHPNVARGLNNLASLLQSTNRLAEAEPLLRRALAIDEASYGSDHPNVAVNLNNLAQLLKETNRLAEAEPLMRRALAIDEASYGSVHPHVAANLNNLVGLLFATNRLAEAEPLMRRALVIDEASYTSDHPNVARGLNNLAQLLQATNRLAEAEPLMRRALAIDEASYGNIHPNVARDLNNLAQLLKHTNRLEEAEPLMRRALAIDEASYASDHPNVAIRLNNLASLLQETNRQAEAEPLMRRVVEIVVAFTSATGHPHPHLMAAANNYAALLMAMEETKEEAVAKALALLAPVMEKLPAS